jgi:hypothetical protein
MDEAGQRPAYLSEDYRLQHLAARLLTAIVQGLTLYFLYSTGGRWSPAEQQIYIPLQLVAVWVPWILYLGVGQMRAVPLAIWVAVAALILAGLGYHEATRESFVGRYSLLNPRAGLWVGVMLGMFIAHVLVVDSVAERRLVPSYERHFDTAWKIGLQVALAGVFVAIFWLVLYLGSQLFLLIKLSFLRELITQPLFVYLASTLAMATALHLTDIQASLLRGLRSVVLTLFSMLLPVLAVIVLGFLLTLPFVSLETLWGTRFAGSLLLSSTAVLVLLINAAYQDAWQSRLKFLFVSLASIELVPLIALAAWAIALRVGQHGWTTDRIFATAVAGILLGYAAGYVLALARGSAWQRSFETANVLTAYAILAVILALFTPLADPGRLMVADQLARLRSGAVDAASFDYAALSRDGAHWGKAALEELRETKDISKADTVNERAREALAGRPSSQIRAHPWVKLTADLVEVFPSGRTLPESFFSAEHGAFRKANPACAQRSAANRKCRATFITANDGRPEAILFFDSWVARVYEQNAEGDWELSGTAQGRTHCKSVREAMADTEPALEAHAWPDLLIGGERLTIVPNPVGPCG